MSTDIAECGEYPPEIAAWTSADKEKQIEAGQRLEKQIQSAFSRGDSIFRIPAGNYRYPGVDGIRFEEISDFSIDATDATFWFTPEVKHAIHFRNCRNVKLSGLTIDMDGLPFLQGTVRAIDHGKKLLVAEFEDYFIRRFHEESGQKEFRVMLLTPDGSRENDNLDFRPLRREVVPDGGNRLAISIHDDVAEHWSRQLRPPHPGDRIVLGMRHEGGMLLVDGCGDMSFEHITVYASPCFAFYEIGYGDGGNGYRNCRLARRPGTGRLLASAADCFHSMNQRRGPLLEQCDFAWAMDDLVNIHGYFHVVLERLSENEVLIATPFGTRLRTGSELTFYAPPCGEEMFRASATEWTPLPGTEAEGLRRIKQLYSERFAIALNDFPDGYLCRVKLDRPVNPEPATLAASYDSSGAGAVLRGNHLHDGHVRGILLKSSGCRIEHNRIERIALNGIVLKPELFWLEGPMPKEIRIEHNELNGCAFGYTGIAAILVMSGCCPPPADRFTAAVNAENILIAENRIDGCNAGPAIVVANCRNPQVRGNEMINLYSNPNVPPGFRFPSILAEDTALSEEVERMKRQRSPILFLGCENVDCEDNRVFGPVPHSAPEPTALLNVSP